MNGTSVPAAATTTTSTTSTTARRWSIVVLVTSWSLAGLAIALVPFTEPTWHVGQWYGLVDTADAIVFGAVAYALLARGRHPVSWLVALCAVGGGLAALSLQWSMLVMAHPDLPELVFLQTAQSWAWVPGTYAMIIRLAAASLTYPFDPPRIRQIKAASTVRASEPSSTLVVENSITAFSRPARYDPNGIAIAPAAMGTIAAVISWRCSAR